MVAFVVNTGAACTFKLHMKCVFTVELGSCMKSVERAGGASVITVMLT